MLALYNLTLEIFLSQRYTSELTTVNVSPEVACWYLKHFQWFIF